MSRNNFASSRFGLLAVALVLLSIGRAGAVFDLQFSIPSPGSFTAEELQILNTAVGRVETMWETAITGYRPGITINSVPISVLSTTSGLASAQPTGTTFQGGFTLTTSGLININVNEIENFANWQGDQPNGLNFIDELLAHETGHVLGIGTLWTNNGVYVNGTYQYTGQFGIAAYKAEFDPAATFVPVENAGNPGTYDSHWDQRMRSSALEGNPSDPWPLDPRVGVTDQYGRDRALEVMTGAIDPDFGPIDGYITPFVSRTTVESMRDLGYTVARFEDFNGDGSVDVSDLVILQAHLGETGLQVDSFAFGDADRDRDVDSNDLALWVAAVPEPSTPTLIVLALAGLAPTFRRARAVRARCATVG